MDLARDVDAVDVLLRDIMSQAPEPVRWHQPVMAAEAVHFLNPRPGATIVEGTLGTGGHSLVILPRLLPHGRLIAIDRDPHALAIAKQRLAEFDPHVTLIRGDFRDVPSVLARLGTRRVDGVFLDLGMSSLQVDEPSRGFSFSKDGSLDMRMDPDQIRSAADLVNRLSSDELTDLLRMLGEERFATRIAHHIVGARRQRPITTTTQLARIVVEAVPPGARHGRIHPATRTFQALRMAVNDELGALEALLDGADTILNHGGRIVILTFHSLEDRMVKRAFLAGMRQGRWTVLTKKPLRPAAEEVAANARARSAKLRAVERL